MAIPPADRAEPAPPTHSDYPIAPREWGWVLVTTALVLLVASLPYALIWWSTPPGMVWPGVLYNFDDQTVYLAWIRQARDGHFFLRNLFTNEPQTGHYVHLYFAALGMVARLTGIPLAYHLGRVAGGAVLLLLVYRLAALLTDKVAHRRQIFLVVALSAGFGWITMGPRVELSQPVDTWQPEAITFLSLYTNGLFTVSLAAMAAIVVGLLLAEARRRARYAVGAGLAGLFLANIHTYDVITLAAVWLAYLVVRTIRLRAIPRAALGYALLAAVVALPGVAWMAWFFATETVFQKRVAVPTLTPPFGRYVVGYGLLWPLCGVGLLGCWRRARAAVPASFGLAASLLGVWVVVGCALPYLPVPFQRKLVQGLHLPVAIGAGLGLALLLDRLAAVGASGRSLARAAGALILCVASLTNVRFVVRDLVVAREQNLASTGLHPVYWPAEDLRLMRWMERHLPPTAVVGCFPPTGTLLTVVTGRTVYAGHWGETPAFERKMQEAIALFRGRMGPHQVWSYCRQRGITHLFVGRLERALAAGEAETLPPADALPFLAALRLLHREGDSAIYLVPAELPPAAVTAPG